MFLTIHESSTHAAMDWQQSWVRNERCRTFHQTQILTSHMPTNASATKIAQRISKHSCFTYMHAVAQLFTSTNRCIPRQLNVRLEPCMHSSPRFIHYRQSGVLTTLRAIGTTFHMNILLWEGYFQSSLCKASVNLCM
jgi:hypothetical protein